MKELWVLLAGVAVVLPAVGGCEHRSVRQSTVAEAVRDYDLAYEAALEVMSRYFVIRQADRARGIVVAMAVPNSDGRMGKAKTEVSAKIFASRLGGYDVEVRATNFMELSEPYALSSKTPRYEWQQASFDSNLEAKLLNEINALRMDGQRAAYQNKFLETPEDAFAPPVN